MKRKLLIAAIITVAALGILLALGLFCLKPLIQEMRQETKKLEVNTYQISDPDIPAAFSGFRIAQVSDLHNTQFGEDNRQLLELIRDSDPDIIVITGDLIDVRKTDIEIAVSFARAAVEIAPCYFVNGNHEAASTDRPELLKRLSAEGVAVLEDSKVSLEQYGETITLLGIDDPTLSADYPKYGSAGVAKMVLEELTEGDSGYKILLAHHPEWIEAYKDTGIDLVLSGHTHGGQLRFEKFGAVIAPGQGFFPEYDAGLFHEGDTSMIISRGLGSSRINLRLNNPPELVIVELQ